MKTILTLSLMMIPSFLVFGQVDWTRQSQENPNASTGPGTAISHDIALGSGGALYITGDFTGKSSFEQVVFPADVYNSMFLAKYNQNGDLDWARRVRGNSNNRSLAVATDHLQHVYIAGTYRQTNALTVLDFGDITMDGATTDGVFLAQADADGTFNWSKSVLPTPPVDLILSDMQVDALGNIYVMGTIADSVRVDSLVFNQDNLGAMTFLAKYRPNGDLAWFKQSNAPGSSGVASVLSGHMTIGSQGQVYVNGEFLSLPILGDVLTWEDDTIETVLDDGQFLARFDSTGNLEWWRSMATNASQFPNELGLDEQDNVYLTLQKGSVLKFSDGDLNSNDFQGNVLLLKYNENGQRQFLTDVAYSDVPSSGTIRNGSVTIHTRPNGTTFMSGLYGANSGSIIVFGEQDTLPMPNISNDGARQFLTAFDKDGNYIDLGVIVEEYITAPDFYWENTAMISDVNSNFYLTGKFAGELRLGADSLLTPGFGSATGQAFTIKFDPQGILDLSSTSIEDQQSLNEQLRVYPNPTRDWLTLEILLSNPGQSGKVRIFNLQGQQLLTQAFRGESHRLDISSLSAGLYFCRVEINGQTLSQKVFIQ